MLSQVAELIIFIFLGHGFILTFRSLIFQVIKPISVTCIEEFVHDFFAHWNTGLFFITLFSITLFRFISVFGLTYILNQVRDKPITINDQIIIAVSGLRGGIAFSLMKLLTADEIPQIHSFMCPWI